MRRRYKSRANKQVFQWFADISTLAGKLQIISVSAGGDMVKQRLKPFFEAYKYYKLGNVSVKLVPASTLPVDPTGLSYTEGDQLVDPRDQLSPGLTRITNGEDVFSNLNGVSAENQHKIYNTMMLDRRWFKWQLQSGLKRYASPRYWQIGQFHQDYFPGSNINIPEANHDSSDHPIEKTNTMRLFGNGAGQNLVDEKVWLSSSSQGLFQTGHRGRLGWMPTDAFVNGANGYFKDTPLSAAVPEIEVYKIILPPAYKTLYYYRMFVTETVYFKEPIVNNFVDDGDCFSSLDRFIRSPYPWNEMLPTVADSPELSDPSPNNDGGGSR